MLRLYFTQILFSRTGLIMCIISVHNRFALGQPEILNPSSNSPIDSLDSSISETEIESIISPAGIYLRDITLAKDSLTMLPGKNFFQELKPDKAIATSDSSFMYQITGSNVKFITIKKEILSRPSGYVNTFCYFNSDVYTSVPAIL